MDIKTYPEMNEKIPTLLRMDTDDSGNPDKLSHYAAQLIEEQAAQLTAAEEVLWYQHCAIECASSATSCGSCGQCSAVKEAKQKFESYHNTYGKGE